MKICNAIWQIALHFGGGKMAETNIAVGQPAPDFDLLASTLSGRLTLSSLQGKIVVLAFYVLDFTST